ncbi:MAG: hypothetical protein GY903_20355 [Fuerstiella sp.]|nr:hypothetical protein [Fuerstiella sp.]MCP4856841.1 hypothetical protein [Fuerstiella sp.]
MDSSCCINIAFGANNNAVANAGHGYRPTPEGAEIKPSKDEIDAMELAWFREYLR